MTTKLEAAQELADEVLFPTANEIDAMDVVPRQRLDLLAEQGWYGLSAPSSGIDMVSGRPIVEAFAGGCLTTSLVWMQHLGQPPACAFGPEHLRHWLEPLASGEIRSTVAYAGLRPDAPLRARAEGDDWVLDGIAPWVSGWGLTTMIDVAACALAVRAASALLVAEGSGSVECGAHAERLYREAGMLLVFGSRPSIRSALLTALG